MARCSRCGGRAVARIAYAKLSLCRNHYTEYIESRILKTMKRYGLVKPGSTVLAAVSGGKDSVTMLVALNKLASQLNYRLYVLHIDLGIREYSVKSRGVVERLSRELGLPLLLVSVKEVLGLSVPELALRARRPYCSVCGVVKRFIMNAAAVEVGADAIATGHNIDDITAYAQKEFLNQNEEALNKLGPKTPSIEGVAVGKIRPLYETYEREALVYALVNRLAFVEDECPYVRSDTLENMLKFKMAELEEGGFRGLKLSFVRRLASRALRGGGVDVARCESCGLISSGGLCSYCKLTSRVLGEPMGMRTREYIRGLVARASSGGEGARQTVTTHAAT